MIRGIAVVSSALLAGGFMLADGIHAFLTGSYIGNGLGLWAYVIRAVGLDPYAAAVKTAFVLLGAAWLCGLASYARGRPQLVITAAVATLWYLPMGTLCAAITLLACALHRQQHA